MRQLLLILFCASSIHAANDWVLREDFATAPATWRGFGNTNLFVWNSTNQNLDVTWDSAQTNSYFYLPLNLTVTRSDDFRVKFTLLMSEIATGTDPLKPYTFELAAGLINTTNAFDPQMFRGSGINVLHGPRNLVEFDYFPDSGLGATISPTIASKDNQIAFSDNHPFEIIPGVKYQIEMAYSSSNATLSTIILADGEPFGPINDLTIPTRFTNFVVNAFAVSSYSDAGQNPPQFAGSLLARGALDDVEITIYHHPTLQIARAENGNPVVQFDTESGWNYSMEASADLLNWVEVGSLIEGTGAKIAEPLPLSEPYRFFRVRAERQ